MPTGRPKAELVLTEAERSQLSSMARSRSIPVSLALRARIVLATAEGEPNSQIAERMQITGATAGKWRGRFIERRINGLYDRLRPGKPRTIDAERVAELITEMLHTKPAGGATHWSVRSIAAETTISPTSVHRFATSSCWAFTRIAASRSSCPPIRLSSTSCATSWACT